MAPFFFGKEDIPLFPRVELSFATNESHKLMTPLGLHREIHPVMRDTGASWLLPPTPPSSSFIGSACLCPSTSWPPGNMAAKIKQEKKEKGLTWQRATDELHSLHVCLSLCKCHRQSRNAKLLCFSGCLLSCSRTKGNIYINTVPMSVTHAARQRRAPCRKDHMFHIMD